MKLFLWSCSLVVIICCGVQAQEEQYLSYSYEQLDLLTDKANEEGDYETSIAAALAAQNKAQTEGKDSLWAFFTIKLSNYYIEIGAYEQAKTLGKQGLKTIQQLTQGNHPTHAFALSNMGLWHDKMGEYEQAIAYYQQALAMMQQEAPNYTHTLNHLAGIYQDLGDYEKALTLILKAVEINEKYFGENNLQHIILLNDLGLLYYDLGEYKKAKKLYLKAKKIADQTIASDHAQMAILFNNLALLHQDDGDSEQALACFKKAYEIEKKILEESHPDLALSLHNIGTVYHDLDNYEKALYYYQAATQIEEAAWGIHHPDLNVSYNNMAFLHLEHGHFEAAKILLQKTIYGCTYFNQPLEITTAWCDSLLAVSYPSNDHLDNTIITLNYIDSYVRRHPTLQQKAEKRLLLADLMVQLLSKLRNDLYNEKDKLRVLRKSTHLLKRQLSLLQAPQQSAQAFTISDLNKSTLLLQATQSEEDYQMGNLPDSLIELDKQLYQRKAQLQAALLENRPKEEKEQLRSLLIEVHQAIELFQKELQEFYPAYYQLKYQENRITVKQVQATLPPATALLEYFITDSLVHIFYIDQQQVQWKQHPIGVKQLYKKIQAFRQALSNYSLLIKDEQKAYHNYTKHAHWFYQQLLAPVLEGKEDLEQLIVVPDGALGFLPFEAFLVEEAPQDIGPYQQLHYLLQDYNISYNYSAALWKQNTESSSQSNNGQLLAVAANYELLDSSNWFNRLPAIKAIRKGLTPLPSARAEVEALEKHFKGFFAFDRQASEQLVKQKAPDYAILHFATHGILDREEPVLSSLALTETGDSTENNFWQAYEISKMELKADLVVLSACETGFGKLEEGNGIASLARSFMYAGAPSLVVSLWQVNDYATSTIMQNFYQHLTAGMTKDAALRQAKLDYIAVVTGNAAHPALWSPFIQLGNTAPVDLAQKGELEPWFWGLLGVVVVVGVGLWWASKSKAAA